jgi:hypothetical protein
VSETEISDDIRLKLSKGDVRLFRNNVGVLKDVRGQYVAYGLCPGSGDLIGFKSVTITPEMVGKRLAVFVSVEVKVGKKDAAKHQAAWRDMVIQFGGLAGVAHSAIEAAAIIESDDG